MNLKHLKLISLIFVFCISCAGPLPVNKVKEEPIEYQIINKVLDYDDLDQEAVTELVSDIEANYSIPNFVNALQDSDYEYRGGAALILGLLKHNQSTSKLLYMAVNDPSPFCRSMATIALFKIDEKESKNKAWLNLLKEFENPATEPAVKSIVAMTMGDIGDTRATPYLIEALKDKNTESFVLGAVIKTIWDMEDPQATSALIEFISRQDIKSYARRDAVMALSAIGNDEAVAFLSDILNSQNYDYHTRVDAASALSYTFNQKAISALITAANDSNKGIRFFAVDALGQIADERAKDTVVDALNDRSECVRARATVILGFIGDEATLPMLKKMLNDDGLCFKEKISERARHSIEQIKERINNNKPEKHYDS